MFRCESKFVFSHFSGIGQPYRNTFLLSESSVLTPGGRGHFGTASFFYEAQKANVQGVEDKGREQYLKKLRGFELEAIEQEAKMKGIGQSNH